MAKVYVSEYARGTLTSGSFMPSAEEPALASYVLDTAGTHLSATFNADTRFVRVHTDGIISYKFGTAPTATTSDMRMAANQTEYFGVVKGHKIDVVANT